MRSNGNDGEEENGTDADERSNVIQIGPSRIPRPSNLADPHESTTPATSTSAATATAGVASETTITTARDIISRTILPFRRRINPELEHLYHARELIEGISNRAAQRASRALDRSRGLAIAIAAASSSPEISLDTSTPTSTNEQQEQRRTRRTRRRRRRVHDSSSENEESLSRRRRRAESLARRRRRAHNVVESLRELMLVPTSSTLGESTEGGTPRSNASASASAIDTSSGNTNASSPSETGNDTSSSNNNNNNNGNSAAGEGAEIRNHASLGISVDSLPMFLNRGEDIETNNNANNNNNDDSDDDSIDFHYDTQNSTDGMEFEIGSLIDRNRILNNFIQGSMGMLRDMEGSSSFAQHQQQISTDLKCPVCSEVFIDYEASDHPNALGSRRSATTRCSHGALTLFTKLHHCPICFEEDIEPPNVISLACGHVVCKEDFCKLGGHVGTDRPIGRPRPKPVPCRGL